jgi:hypothetical protein
MKLTLTETRKILDNRKQATHSLSKRGKLVAVHEDGQTFIDSDSVYHYISNRKKELTSELTRMSDAKSKLDKHILTYGV